MFFDLNELTFLIVTIESLLFGVVSFLVKKKTGRFDNWLGLLLIVIAFYYATAYIAEAHKPVIIWFQPLLFILFLSVSPLNLIYIQSLTIRGFRIRKRHLLLFLPALLFGLIFSFIYYPLTYEEKMLVIGETNLDIEKTGITKTVLVAMFQFLSVPVYYVQLIVNIILMLLYHRKYTAMIRDEFVDTENIRLKWVKFFILLSIANAVFEFFCLLFFDSSILKQIEVLTYLLMVGMVTVLGIFGVKQLLNFQEMESHREEAEPDQSKEVKKRPIQDDIARKIVQSLEHLMEEEQLFLENGLSLDHISSKIGINKKYISQTINSHYQKSFPDMVHEYRINHAIKLIGTGFLKNHTIEGLAKESGYLTRSSFYTAFEKCTGQKLTDYLNIHSQ